MLTVVELNTVVHVLSNALPGALPPPAALFDGYLGFGLGVCSAGIHAIEVSFTLPTQQGES